MVQGYAQAIAKIARGNSCSVCQKAEASGLSRMVLLHPLLFLVTFDLTFSLTING
jgi:hypothetical protein